MSQTLLTLEQNLDNLVRDFAADVKTITAGIGTLANLTTAQKGSLVGAINELQSEVEALVSGGSAVIDDSATAGNTTATFSADKVLSLLAQYKNDLLGGVGAAGDTLLELYNDNQTQGGAINNLLTAVGNRVRFDAAQVLTDEQRATARGNILAASAAELDALEAAVGDTTIDLRAVYRSVRDA